MTPYINLSITYSNMGQISGKINILGQVTEKFNIIGLISELQVEIFLYLSLYDLLSIRRVSVNLKKLVTDDKIWDNLIEIFFYTKLTGIDLNKYMVCCEFSKCWACRDLCGCVVCCELSKGLTCSNKITYENIFKKWYTETRHRNIYQMIYWSIKNKNEEFAKKVMVENNKESFMRCKKLNKKSLIYFAASKGLSTIVEHLIISDFYTVDEPSTGKQSPLYIACQKGHIDVVVILIKYGAKINAPNGNGSTALHVASQYGHCKIIELLLFHGADINALFDKKYTPLSLACIYNCIPSIKILILHGADINHRNIHGHTPLFHAIEYTNPLIVRGATNNIDVVKFLVDSNVDLYITDNNGIDPSYMAVKLGHSEIVDVLIKSNRVDINKIYPDGSTLLYIACKSGHIECVLLLLENGADVNICYNNFPILHIAIEENHLHIISILLSIQNININYEVGRQTALFTACIKNNLDIANLLVSNGATKLISGRKGKNLLHFAFENNFTNKITKWLISEFFHLSFQPDINGIIPFDMIPKIKDPEILQAIIKMGKPSISNTYKKIDK